MDQWPQHHPVQRVDPQVVGLALGLQPLLECEPDESLGSVRQTGVHRSRSSYEVGDVVELLHLLTVPASAKMPGALCVYSSTVNGSAWELQDR